jgi:hypothetical protein
MAVPGLLEGHRSARFTRDDSGTMAPLGNPSESAIPNPSMREMIW